MISSSCNNVGPIRFETAALRGLMSPPCCNQMSRAGSLLQPLSKVRRCPPVTMRRVCLLLTCCVRPSLPRSVLLPLVRTRMYHRTFTRRDYSPPGHRWRITRLACSPPELGVALSLVNVGHRCRRGLPRVRLLLILSVNCSPPASPILGASSTWNGIGFVPTTMARISNLACWQDRVHFVMQFLLVSRSLVVPSLGLPTAASAFVPCMGRAASAVHRVGLSGRRSLLVPRVQAWTYNIFREILFRHCGLTRQLSLRSSCVPSLAFRWVDCDF